MAVIVKTSDPAGLLAAIRKAIDDGHVVTWSYDADGDFTHTPEQWKFKAWMRPSIPTSPTGEIRFYILHNRNVNMTRAIYGVYHGRFIEMLLSHFDTRFQNATATAMPITGDVTSSS
jgi:hypothetical protein